MLKGIYSQNEKAGKSLPLIFCFFILLISACTPKKIIFTRSQLLMGHVPVNISMRIRNSERESALQATEKAYARAREVESKISTYQPNSDVSCLNRKAGKDFCTLSEETLKLIEHSMKVSNDTNGVFDIRFSSLSEQGRLGKISRFADQVKLMNADTRVSLNSAGKGFIVDEMIETLKMAGFQNVLVNAGGDLRAMGSSWKVSIQIPQGLPGKNSKTFRIKNRAMATSGNDEEAGHIVNARTGEKIHRSSSVTVLADTLMLANTLSTAFYAMGPEESGKKIQNFSGTQAIWVDKNGKTIFIKRKKPGRGDFIPEAGTVGIAPTKF